jgi:hypothetical protein
MRCNNCKARMVSVGTVGAGRDRNIYAEGFVCPTRGCSGYGAVHHGPNPVNGALETSFVQHPAMTLMTSTPLHARIAGAIMFKEGR